MPDLEPMFSSVRPGSATVKVTIFHSEQDANLGSGAEPMELIKLLAGEIEERGRKKGEHENTEKIAGGERAHDFGAEGEKIGAPGKTKNGCQPMRDAIGDFRVLQKGDDDAEQAENAAGGDQAARIESAGTGFAFVLFLCGGFH